MVTALRGIQIGKESVAGTRVAADIIWLGSGEMTDQRTWHAPDTEERNSLSLEHRQIEVAKQSQFVYRGSITFEQILFLLDMGVKGSVSPSTPTNGVLTRDWTYTPNNSSLNVPETYTIEYFDNQQEYEFGHGIVEQMALNFPMGEVGNVQATLFGQGTAKATKTAALSDPTVEDVVSQKGKIYIDTSWANLGNTQKSGLLANSSIAFTTGFAPVPLADGSTDFSTYAERKRALDVTMTLRHNSDGVAQFDNYAAATGIFVRLEWTGSEIEQVTPTYDKLLRVDMALRFKNPPRFFGDHEGLNTIEMNARTFKDPTSGNDFSFFVRNTVTGT